MDLGRNKDRFGTMCEEPEPVETKRGTRCGQVCTDDRGRRRFKFVPGEECQGKLYEGVPEEGSPEVQEFTGFGRTPLVRITPMPLVPLSELMPGRRSRRRRGG